MDGQNTSTWPPMADDPFAEVLVEATPVREEPPVREPVRPLAGGEKTASARRIRRFLEMRRLALGNFPPAGRDKRQQAAVFYQQARMMEDFEDDYQGDHPFSMYFPSYQMMDYEQWRTYFSWRTRVRQGEIRRTSFSYVFVYLYELIHHIGVEDSRDGLRRLVQIWEEYREFEPKLDHYMPIWVKDYYITGGFDVPFASLLEEDERLRRLYTPAEQEDFYAFYAPLSAYKPEQSRFYTEDTGREMRACFNYLAASLVRYQQEGGPDWEKRIFCEQAGNIWQPFPKALYDPSCIGGESRTVRFSDTEVYWYDGVRWKSSRNRMCKESGRRLIGLLFKRVEQFYRQASGYRYRLNVDPGGMLSEEKGFWQRVDGAIQEYYRLSHRKVVTVDPVHLDRIRENALQTQEKLLVEPETYPETEAPAEGDTPGSEWTSAGEEGAEAPLAVESSPEGGDPWAALVYSFTAAEREAVRLLLDGAPLNALYDSARRHDQMLEVLVDGLNQKALDAVGDTLVELSDAAVLYDDYREDLERGMRYESE